MGARRSLAPRARAQAFAEGGRARPQRSCGPAGAAILARDGLGPHQSTTGRPVFGDVASTDRDLLIGLAGESAPVAVDQQGLLTAIEGGLARLGARRVAEAVRKATAELGLAAVPCSRDAATEISAHRAETLEPIALRRRAGHHARRSDQHDDRSDPHESDQDLLIVQATVVVPPAGTVTFSVFFPSVSCQTSTS